MKTHPAFPVKDSLNNHYGITIQEYVSTKAMQGIIMNSEMMKEIKNRSYDKYNENNTDEKMATLIAEKAIKYADALLKELGQK